MAARERGLFVMIVVAFSFDVILRDFLVIPILSRNYALIEIATIDCSD